MAIAAGDYANITYVNKFGQASGIQTADGIVDVWDGVANANADNTYTYSTTADIDTVSSSNNGDTQVIEIQGLDTNWNLVTQNVTLTGQTKATLGTPLIRAFRMKNLGATNNAGAVYCYVDDTVVSGVPQTNNKIRMIMAAGNNQTLHSLYSIPAGYTGYILQFYYSVSKKVSCVADTELRVRPFGGVFQLKNTISIGTNGSSNYTDDRCVPDSVSAKSDIAMRGSVSANDSGISAGFTLILVKNA